LQIAQLSGVTSKEITKKEVVCRKETNGYMQTLLPQLLEQQQNKLNDNNEHFMVVGEMRG
jgi:hypothetical protein